MIQKAHVRCTTFSLHSGLLLTVSKYYTEDIINFDPSHSLQGGERSVIIKNESLMLQKVIASHD